MPTRPFTTLDLSTWPRVGLYRHFLEYSQPQYTITTRVDVSTVMRDHVPQGVSPYRACAYAIGRAANEVEAFRLRMVDGSVRLFDRVDLSSTVATPDGLFAFSYTDFDPDWVRFDAECAAHDEAARRGHPGPADAEARRDLIYLSCMPWIDIHGMTHALSSASDDIPRVSWGRIVAEPGPPGATDDSAQASGAASERHRMGVCVVVHHALVDGADVASFVTHLQHVLDTTPFAALSARQALNPDLRNQGAQ